MKSMYVVGIMNGTSLDGVDFVLCNVQKKNRKTSTINDLSLSIQFLDQAKSSFDKQLYKNLRNAAQHNMKVDELAELHHELGRFYATELSCHVHKKRWSIDLIGLHGQTVYHRGGHATLQIGESAYLSEKFKIPVVSNFRSGDIAAGGQGAPLATFFHVHALAKKEKSIAVNNLGGVSNVSYVHSIKPLKVMAFDTGPANLLVDMAMQKLSHGQKLYDHSGQMARCGIWNQKCIEKWLKHPFFKQKPPKSCGREEFGETFFKQCWKQMNNLHLSSEDKIATLSEFTVQSIVQTYKLQLPSIPERLIICGGGGNNMFFIKRLKYHLFQTHVTTSDELGWPLNCVEGGAFALLAAARVWGIHGNIPQTTGASHSSILGNF